MGGQGHMTGAQPLCTFQHFLDDLKLLNIMSDDTWWMPNFSPFFKCIHLHQVSKSFLYHPINEGWWRNNEINNDMGQLVYPFITLPTQTSAKHNYRVTVVWCHPTQSKVNINVTLGELKNHNLNNGPLMVLVWVFNNASFWILSDPLFVGLTICNDPRWLKCMAPFSKLRIRQLFIDEKGLVISPRELINGFIRKKTWAWAWAVVASSTWQWWSTNDGVTGAIYRESEGITPGQPPDVTPAPSKELPQAGQDTGMASADGDKGQGNEEHTRLTSSVTVGSIPATTPKHGPPTTKMSSRNSTICAKHPHWRKRQSFWQKSPKGDSSIEKK